MVDLKQGILKGEISLYYWPPDDWFGLICFANKNKNCQFLYSWFQTSQTEGQQYSDTSPFSIPCLKSQDHFGDKAPFSKWRSGEIRNSFLWSQTLEW